MDEKVREEALELLEKVPPELVEEVFRAQVQKLRGPPRIDDPRCGRMEYPGVFKGNPKGKHDLSRVLRHTRIAL